MTVTDVNEAFKAERLDQIASIRAWNAGIPARAAAAEEAAAKLRADNEQRIADGKLVPIGGGAYRVNDPGSYDNGEVWTLQQPRGMTLEQPLLLPSSNLDESTGSAALYTRVPAWHALGTVIPEGVSDLDEVLRLGKIDFRVVQKPARFAPAEEKGGKTLLKPATLVIPDTYVNVRDDTGAPLGVVGRIYAPFQAREMGAFLQDLVIKYNVVFESAGATYGGRHVFIGMRLPEDVTLDLGDGVTDLIIPYLYFLNGNDGSASASVTVSPWRVECGNTERFNLRDAVATWRVRHTINALEDSRLNEARRTLGLSGKYFGRFKAEEEALARTELALREFEEVASELWPKPGKAEATPRKLATWDERMGTLTGMFREQGAQVGRTAYAAERVFTDYLDNVAPRRALGDTMAAARATALIEGSDDHVKSKAHKLLLTLAS